MKSRRGSLSTIHVDVEALRRIYMNPGAMAVKRVFDRADTRGIGTLSREEFNRCFDILFAMEGWTHIAVLDREAEKKEILRKLESGEQAEVTWLDFIRLASRTNPETVLPVTVLSAIEDQYTRMTGEKSRRPPPPPQNLESVGMSQSAFQARRTSVINNLKLQPLPPTHHPTAGRHSLARSSEDVVVGYPTHTRIRSRPSTDEHARGSHDHHITSLPSTEFSSASHSPPNEPQSATGAGIHFSYSQPHHHHHSSSSSSSVSFQQRKEFISRAAALFVDQNYNMFHKVDMSKAGAPRPPPKRPPMSNKDACRTALAEAASDPTLFVNGGGATSLAEARSWVEEAKVPSEEAAPFVEQHLARLRAHRIKFADQNHFRGAVKAMCAYFEKIRAPVAKLPSALRLAAMRTVAEMLAEERHRSHPSVELKSPVSVASSISSTGSTKVPSTAYSFKLKDKEKEKEKDKKKNTKESQSKAKAALQALLPASAPVDELLIERLQNNEFLFAEVERLGETGVKAENSAQLSHLFQVLTFAHDEHWLEEGDGSSSFESTNVKQNYVTYDIIQDDATLYVQELIEENADCVRRETAAHLVQLITSEHLFTAADVELTVEDVELIMSGASEEGEGDGEDEDALVVRNARELFGHVMEFARQDIHFESKAQLLTALKLLSFEQHNLTLEAAQFPKHITEYLSRNLRQINNPNANDGSFQPSDVEIYEDVSMPGGAGSGQAAGGAKAKYVQNLLHATNDGMLFSSCDVEMQEWEAEEIFYMEQIMLPQHEQGVIGNGKPGNGGPGYLIMQVEAMKHEELHFHSPAQLIAALKVLSEGHARTVKLGQLPPAAGGYVRNLWEAKEEEWNDSTIFFKRGTDGIVRLRYGKGGLLGNASTGSRGHHSGKHGPGQSKHRSQNTGSASSSARGLGLKGKAPHDDPMAAAIEKLLALLATTNLLPQGKCLVRTDVLEVLALSSKSGPRTHHLHGSGTLQGNPRVPPAYSLPTMIRPTTDSPNQSPTLRSRGLSPGVGVPQSGQAGNPVKRPVPPPSRPPFLSHQNGPGNGWHAVSARDLANLPKLPKQVQWGPTGNQTTSPKNHHQNPLSPKPFAHSGSGKQPSVEFDDDVEVSDSDDEENPELDGRLDVLSFLSHHVVQMQKARVQFTRPDELVLALKLLVLHHRLVETDLARLPASAGSSALGFCLSHLPLPSEMSDHKDDIGPVEIHARVCEVFRGQGLRSSPMDVERFLREGGVAGMSDAVCTGLLVHLRNSLVHGPNSPSAAAASSFSSSEPVDHLLPAVRAGSVLSSVIWPRMSGLPESGANYLKDKMLGNAILLLDREAAYANLCLQIEPMREIVERAARLGHSSPDIERLRRLLAGPEKRLSQLQLLAAKRMGDSGRVVRMMVLLKDMFFGLHGVAELFHFSRFPKLRVSADWAGRKRMSLNKKDLAKGMLVWSKQPLHASLTILSATEAKTSLRMFKNLLSWMGDRPSDKGQPFDLALMILAAGHQSVWLRDEIYCQLMKQLTMNQHQASVVLGWQMMTLLLETFPPSQILENYLEVFLRTAANIGDTERSSIVRLLHASIIDPLPPTPPTPDDVLGILSGHKTLRPSAVASELPYIVPEVLPEFALQYPENPALEPLSTLIPPRILRPSTALPPVPAPNRPPGLPGTPGFASITAGSNSANSSPIVGPTNPPLALVSQLSGIGHGLPAPRPPHPRKVSVEDVEAPRVSSPHGEMKNNKNDDVAPLTSPRISRPPPRVAGVPRTQDTEPPPQLTVTASLHIPRELEGDPGRPNTMRELAVAAAAASSRRNSVNVDVQAVPSSPRNSAGIKSPTAPPPRRFSVEEPASPHPHSETSLVRVGSEERGSLTDGETARLPVGVTRPPPRAPARPNNLGPRSP